MACYCASEFSAVRGCVRNPKRDASHLLQVDGEPLSGKHSQDKPLPLANGALGRLGVYYPVVYTPKTAYS